MVRTRHKAMGACSAHAGSDGRRGLATSQALRSLPLTTIMAALAPVLDTKTGWTYGPSVNEALDNALVEMPDNEDTAAEIAEAWEDVHPTPLKQRPPRVEASADVAIADKVAAIVTDAPISSNHAALDLEDQEALKAFVMAPVPKTSGTNHCFIIHEPGRVPKFRCFLRRTNDDGTAMMDTFLMCAKKDGGVSHDTYSISTNTMDLEHEGSLVRAHSPFYIGKVRSHNKRRTEFGMYNSGAHDEEVAEGADQTTPPQDLGAIVFVPNVRGGKKKVRGPRRVLIGLPTVDEDDHLTVHSTSGWTGKTTMVDNFKSRDLRGLDVLMSNEGVFDEAIGGFVCNFGESVKEASAVNMQLVKDDGGDAKAVFQCGKASENEYALEFVHPMTPFQAFGIAITAFAAPNVVKK